MRRATSHAILVIAFLVAACQSGNPLTPSTNPAPDIVYRVLPPDGPTPSKDDTLHAIDVFSARLEALRVGTFTAAAGDAITFSLPSPQNDQLVQIVLATPGQVSFVPLGPPDSVQAAEGQPPPATMNALFEGDQIASASVDTDATSGPTVTIYFKDAGARSFAAYTSTHVGDFFAIVVDGRILVMPVVTSAIPDEVVTISIPAQQRTIPLEALAAILTSGPVPPAWQHAVVSRQ